MKRKRRKRKLTAKQAKRIATIITAVYLIIAIISVIASKEQDKLYYMFVACGSAGVIWGLFYIFILKGDKAEYEEKTRKIEAELANILSKTEFKQVSFQMIPDTSAIEMLLNILEKEQAKFYARLAENNEIILKCIDKHGDVVYLDKISNLHYFKKFFKVS